MMLKTGKSAPMRMLRSKVDSELVESSVATVTVLADGTDLVTPVVDVTSAVDVIPVAVDVVSAVDVMLILLLFSTSLSLSSVKIIFK